MCESCSDRTRTEIESRLRDATRLLILTHARPDGDGLGAMVALARAARAAGKSADLLLLDAPPWRCEFLLSGESPADADRFDELADAADAIVILDTCAFAQLDGLDERLPRCRDKAMVIDHHATCDDVAGLQWVDTSAAAVGVLVLELLESLDWPIDSRAAEALMVALTTDTGWLVFANTDARCLRAAARLSERGVRTDVLYRRLYQSERPQRMRLRIAVLESLELHCDDRLAVMTVRRSDFERTGARPDETENLVNEALRMATVEEAVILIENDDVVRVSLRSRDDVDVAEIARRFGGGGHARAAGFRAEEDVDAVRKRLIDVCTAELARLD